MKPFVTTVAEAIANPSALIWAAGREWDHPKGEIRDRYIISTSSWQDAFLKAQGMSAHGISAIAPVSIDALNYKFPEFGSRIKVVFRPEALDDNSSSLAQIIFQALIEDFPDVDCVIFGKPKDGLTVNRVRFIEHFTEAQYQEELESAQFFVYPAVEYHAQPLVTLQAITAGCFPIVPAHSGFAEFIKTGMPVPLVMTEAKPITDYADMFLGATVGMIKKMKNQPEHDAIAGAAEISSAIITTSLNKNVTDYLFRLAHNFLSTALT